jgi:histidine triad (HIT) family protein
MTQSPDILATPYNGCPFCQIAAGWLTAEVICSWMATTMPALAIRPLNPVTPGHMLVIPMAHVPDFTTRPEISAGLMAHAADLADAVGGDMNIISSKGPAATQTVFHLHLHLVPRTAVDGLALPWTNQEGTP